jgi:hypothetical protein
MKLSLFCSGGKDGEHIKSLPLATFSLGEMQMGASQNVMEFPSVLIHTMLDALIDSLIWHFLSILLVETRVRACIAS